jgi:methylphosphotriester-DNA--protein-cysteine methyltransferase
VDTVVTEIDTAPASPRLEDLAQQHQVSTRTIRRWLATGKISP